MARPETWRHLLAGCDDAQIEAITSKAAPLLVVAGAGSGKTRVLTRRIAWRIAHGDAVARHVLALTFTRKAAGELRDRLASLRVPGQVTAGTFHAVALAQLRRRAADRRERPPALLESKAPLLATVLAAAAAGTRDRSLVSALAGEIEWAKARLVPPADYSRAAAAAGRAALLDVSTVAACYEGYERERRRRGLVDFDDLLLDLARAIEEDPELAASQRWQFAHLFVDELQDATTSQLRLVDAWLGGRHDLCAVGDPRQSVYAWNGADPDAVAGFARRHRGATVVELSTNYRSSAQVVALAAAALPAAGAPRSGRPDGPVPTLRNYPDEEAEAEAIAAGVRTAHPPGRSWARLAVLARTHAQLDVIAAALARAEVPVRRLGQGGLLGHRAVRQILADLPPRLDGARLPRYLAERVGDVGDGPDGSYDPADGEVLAGLCQVAEDYLALDAIPTSDGFLAFLRATAREPTSAAGRDAVDLATFHAAKGLEWDAVWVAGLEDGLVPIGHARDRAAREEEQRLLYVALTRAADDLHCSWAAERRFGSRRVRREPSPYLAALEGARRRLATAPSREVVMRALAASRQALAAPETRRPTR